MALPLEGVTRTRRIPAAGTGPAAAPARSRRSLTLTAAHLVILCLVAAGPASAREAGPGPLPQTQTEATAPPGAPPLAPDPASPAEAARTPITASPSTGRSPLIPLYVSFAAVQVLDAHSTTRALNRGAVEGNPLMRGFAGSPARLFAVKAAGSIAVVYATERLRKRNRRAAVALMAAVNAATAAVVWHNYRAVR